MPPNLTPLKALIYTRSAADFDRLVESLCRCGCETCAIRADPGADFALVLEPAPDVILVDLEPGREIASGLLALLKDQGLDIPVILIVDGADPALEGLALTCLDQGAADYLFKDRLGRLGAAVRRALEQRDFHRDFLSHSGFRSQNTRGAQNGREGLRHYQRLFEQTHEIILFVRLADGQILEANAAAEQAYGYSRSELLTLCIADLQARETAPLIAPPIFEWNGYAISDAANGSRANTNGANAYGANAYGANAPRIQVEAMHQRKDGSLFPVEVSSLAVILDGQPASLRIIRSTLERKTADQLLDKIFANLDEVVLVQDPFSRVILQCSPAIEKMLGYIPDEVVGKTTEFLFDDPEGYRAFGQELRAALDQGTVLHSERRLRRKDGTYIYAEATVSAIRDEMGKRMVNIGTIHDITGRKQAEAALQENAAILVERNAALAESEERYRRLVDMAPEGIAIYAEGKILFANPSAAQLLGANSPDEVIGRSLYDFIPPETMELAARKLAELMGGIDGGPFEGKIARLDGSRLDVEIIARQVRYQGMQAYQLIGRDIGERKKAEEALRESEERYRRLFEDAVLAVFSSTPEGGVIAVNPSFARMFGYESPEDVKATVKNVSTDIFADPQRRSQVARQAAGIPGTNVFENVYRRKDGSTFPGMLYLHPVLNEDGSVHHFEGLIEDITQRKAAERELQRRMVELEALHDVAVAGSEATSLDDLIQRVVEIIHERLFPDEFGVAFIDEEKGTLTYHPTSYTSAENIILTIPITTGISGAVVRTGAARRVGNVQLDPDYIAANPRTCSQLTVPLVLGSRVIGVINAESYKPDYFSAADESLMIAVAGELATAIEKIRLLDAERDRRQELESLAEISAVVRAAETRAEMLPAILDRMLEVLKAEGAAIAMRDLLDDDLVFELGRGSWQEMAGMRMPLSAGIGGQVVASGEMIYVDQSAGPDPRMFRPTFVGTARYVLCLPLIANEQVTGLLYLGRSRPFDLAEIRLAKATADVIASAFRRVQLHAETVRQLQRLTALRAIDQSILETPDLEKTLRILLEKFTGLLGVDAADFLLYDPRARQLSLAAHIGMPPGPIWDETVPLSKTHSGRVALSGKMDFIPNLAAIEDNLTQFIRSIGERFSSYLCVPLTAKGELKGVMQIFNRTRLDPTPDWMGFLQTLTGQAAIAIDNAQLFNEQQRTNQRLTEAYDATIEGWSRALDMRDRDTEGHSQRVTELTLRLARSLGVPEEELAHIRRGAQLHDIGKMGIPDAILLKPAPLTPDEWQIMCMHPQYALDFLSPIEFLRPALEIPYCHHEKWDGSGYPRGLKGEEIPLPARIFAVVDVWDALTSDRPYRPAWLKEKVLDYIREQAGKKLDPLVVTHFLAALE